MEDGNREDGQEEGWGSEQTDPRERKGLDQEQRMSGWRGLIHRWGCSTC